jgi:hypothetical protein
VFFHTAAGSNINAYNSPSDPDYSLGQQPVLLFKRTNRPVDYPTALLYSSDVGSRLKSVKLYLKLVLLKKLKE